MHKPMALPKILLEPVVKRILRRASQALLNRADVVTSEAVEQIPQQWEYDPKRSFYHKHLEVLRCNKVQKQPKPVSVDQLKFGHQYADYMMDVDWSAEQGWSRPLISPVHNISIHPGAKVLHYAVEILEGLKAYRGIDDRIRLFRADMNMARMRRSAARAALPDFDAEEMIKVLCEMIRLDKEWVPRSAFSSLYIRPVMIGTEPTIGLGQSNQAKLFVVTGPVGAYFPSGFQPISLLADSAFVRAFPGGVGSFKMGCNYAPSIGISDMATKLGCHQMLWLSGEDHKLTEIGAMNVFIYWRNKHGEDELLTPPLNDGLILPGVMRDSVLALAREWGEFKVTERYPTMEEMKEAVAEGRLMQMFGTGTACAVSPIGRLLYRKMQNDKDSYDELHIPTLTSGADVMQRFYETIMDIQYGRIDRPQWVRIIE